MKQKIDKYFNLLHPEYETLTPGQQLELMDDRNFIADHIDEIDKYYEGCMREGSGAQQEGWTEQQIIANAIRRVKVNLYDKQLHPNFDELTPQEKDKALEDRVFIADHIDEIDEIYTTYIYQAERRGKEVDTQELIKSAIEGVRGLQTTFSAQKIGQATINTPTKAKKEAEQVEVGENTIDNIKEGEEVGDDN